MNQIPAPIGMEPLVDAVQQCCLRAQQYHRLGIQPGHFIPVSYTHLTLPTT